MTTVWFTRDSILTAAPDSTVLAVELHITPKTWPTVSNLLKNVPLISDRSLDIEDLASVTGGDLAIFVTKDATRAVAIRASVASLPPDILASYGITAQEVGAGITLLSNTLLPVSGIRSRVRPPFFPTSALWLGRVELPDAKLSGALTFDRDGLLVTFRSPKSSKTSQTSLPEGMLSMMFASPDVKNLSLASSYFLDQAAPLLDLLSQEHQTFVKKDELGATQILISVPNSGWNQGTLVDALGMMGAYLTPRIKDQLLPDGTTSQELLIEPDLAAVEEISVSGHTVYRVVGNGDLAVYGGNFDGQTIISTSASVLTSFLESADQTCKGNVAIFTPTELLQEISNTSYDPQISTMISLFDKIKGISIESKRYSTEIRFCST